MNPTIIQAVVAPMFLLMGLSHLIQPRLWIRFFDVLRQTGIAAAIIPMYTLPIALVLVVGHNIWRWDWALALTVAGWAMTLKCAAYLLVPQAANRVLRTKAPASANAFRVVGAVMALFGAAITWQSWSALLRLSS